MTMTLSITSNREDRLCQKYILQMKNIMSLEFTIPFTSEGKPFLRKVYNYRQ